MSIFTHVRHARSKEISYQRNRTEPYEKRACFPDHWVGAVSQCMIPTSEPLSATDVSTHEAVVWDSQHVILTSWFLNAKPVSNGLPFLQITTVVECSQRLGCLGRAPPCAYLNNTNAFIQESTHTASRDDTGRSSLRTRNGFLPSMIQTASTTRDMLSGGTRCDLSSAMSCLFSAPRSASASSSSGMALLELQIQRKVRIRHQQAATYTHTLKYMHARPHSPPATEQQSVLGVLVSSSVDISASGC